MYSFICFILFIFGVGDACFASSNLIVLGQGSSEKVKIRGAVHFSNSNVVRANDLGQSVELVGRNIGSVEMAAGGKSWHVEVLSTHQFRLYTKLAEQIGRMRGLELAVNHNQIEIAGELLRKSDWMKLAEIHEASANYLFRADMDSDLKKEMYEYFKSLLVDSHLFVGDMKVTPGAELALSSTLMPLKSKYERALQPYGFLIEKNASILQLVPLVRVGIIVAEVRKNMSRKLGIGWPGSAQASLLPSFALANDSQNIGVTLDALESEGQGHLLASPTLLCRSGKTAEFLAGGEIPIKMINYKLAETTWKRYGVLLKISPVADVTGRMSIALSTEVSMLDPSHSVEGIPAMLTNRMDSHFDLKKSRSIALSGLIKNEWFKNSDGLPWLSQIPILGYLFSSKEYKHNETELIIFVTPEVIQPESLDDV